MKKQVCIVNAAAPLLVVLSLWPSPLCALEESMRGPGAKPGVLDVEWTADLGPTQDLIYRTAVCGDGTTFVVTSDGRIVSVSAKGEVSGDRTVEQAAETVYAAACDPDGQLVVVHGPRPVSITTVPRHSRGQPRSIRVHHDEMGAPHAATVNGRFIVLLVDNGRRSPMRDRSVRLAYVNAESGAVERLTTPELTDATAIGDAGSLLWDGSANMVIHVPAGRYRFDEYRADDARENGKRVPSGVTTGANERIVRAAALPGDTRRYAAQVIGHSIRVNEADGREIRKPRARLDILDKELATTESVADGGPGLLIGSDRSGALYFQNIVVNRSVRIIKARLK